MKTFIQTVSDTPLPSTSQPAGTCSVTVHLTDGTHYVTSVNARLSDEAISAYFVGQRFNLGVDGDDMKQCSRIAIQR